MATEKRGIIIKPPDSGAGLVGFQVRLLCGFLQPNPKSLYSAISVVWAAPGAQETIPVAKPTPFGMVSRAPGAAQAHQMANFPVQLHKTIIRMTPYTPTPSRSFDVGRVSEAWCFRCVRFPELHNFVGIRFQNCLIS